MGFDTRKPVDLGAERVFPDGEGILRFEGCDKSGNWRVWIPQEGGVGFTDVWTAASIRASLYTRPARQLEAVYRQKRSGCMRLAREKGRLSAKSIAWYRLAMPDEHRGGRNKDIELSRIEAAKCLAKL